MDGSNLSAGSVAGITDIKNPITAARYVMTNSEHVMLTGAGASQSQINPLLEGEGWVYI
jgi:beta-aspartyl-peptidase (threonine type)